MADDAFAQGRLAYEHNLAMSSCDYPVGSTLRASWMEGWTTARNAAPRPEADHPKPARPAAAAAN